MKTSVFHHRLVIAKQIFYYLFTGLIYILPLRLTAQNADETAIRKILDDQTIAWNNGSIENFMKGYWHSDSLTFVGRNGLKYGYTSALENYKKSYPDTAARGKLYFDILQIKRLSRAYYYVT